MDWQRATWLELVAIWANDVGATIEMLLAFDCWFSELSFEHQFRHLDTDSPAEELDLSVWQVVMQFRKGFKEAADRNSELPATK
jgi:hypothetical protein